MQRLQLSLCETVAIKIPRAYLIKHSLACRGLMDFIVILSPTTIIYVAID